MKKLIFIFSVLIANISFAQNLKEVGKLEYDKSHNLFVFYFMKENRPHSVIINPTSKKDREALKKLDGKSIVVEGEILAYSKTGESFVYREELNNPKFNELNSELLKLDSEKMMYQEAFTSHEKLFKTKYKMKTDKPTFEIKDKSANAVIAVSGTLVGIATGPIAIVPAAAFLINNGAKK